jgi:hypothetical protein
MYLKIEKQSKAVGVYPMEKMHSVASIFKTTTWKYIEVKKTKNIWQGNYKNRMEHAVGF